MTRLVAAIVRHGDYRQLPDTPSAHQPFPLSRKGETQALKGSQELRHQLEQHQLTLHPHIDSSQLLRAWQTARIMIDDLHDVLPSEPKLCSYDAMAERCVGSAANLSIPQIESIVREDPRFEDLPQDWKSNSHFRLPLQGAESLMQAGKRVAEHLETQMALLAESTSEDTVKLFVGHGAAFRHAAYHLGALVFEDIRKLSMYHARPVLLEYRTNSAWKHIGGEWKVRGQNSLYTD